MDEASLLPCVVSLAKAKRAYDKIRSALDQVEATGDGIVMPGIEELTLEIANTRSVTPQLKEEVIEEFYQVCLAQQYIAEGGITYAKELLEKLNEEI